MGLSALGKPSSSGSDKHVKHIDDDQLIVQSLNTDGTPRRPMNAFMIFARRRRPQVSAANQAMRTGEISKILSREWANMPMSEKEFFLDQAKRLKDVFNAKYPDYVYRRRPNNSRKKRKGDMGHELMHDDQLGDAGEDSSDATHGGDWPSPEDDYGRPRHSDSQYASSRNDHGYSPYGHPGDRYSSHAHTHLPPRLNYVPSQGSPATPRPPHPSHSPTILPSPSPYPAYYSTANHTPSTWQSSSGPTWQPPFQLREQRSLGSLVNKHDVPSPPGRPFSAATSGGSPSTSSNASLHGQGISSSSPYVSASTSPGVESFGSSHHRGESYYSTAYGTTTPLTYGHGHGYGVSSSAPTDSHPSQLPRSLSSTVSHSAPDYAPGTLHHVHSPSSGALWDRAGNR
ncbi:hypothetical protein PENSPDRAFT_681230 [Peniophora sp. CONT]|nr:hypothetical protein PENSPDRAFT_681230 [Peniophora sp. CONT]